MLQKVFVHVLFFLYEDNLRVACWMMQSRKKKTRNKVKCNFCRLRQNAADGSACEGNVLVGVIIQGIDTLKHLRVVLVKNKLCNWGSSF